MFLVLVIHCMKRLKIISKYNIKYFFLLVVMLSLLFTKFYKLESKYTGKENEIEGYIVEKYYKNDKLTIILKGKEKLIIKYNKNKKFQIHDYILVTGKLSRPNQNTNFNLFNYKKYLYNKKIFYIMNANNIKIIKKNNNIFYSIRNNIEKKINRYKSKKYLNIFILGNKKELNDNYNNIYRKLGIIHLLSISGSYISILILILNKFIKNKKIIIIILIAYIFLTNFQTSILRSCLCYIFILISKRYNIKMENKDILLFIASLLLIINPFYLYDIGFLLSFSISYGLIYFNDLIVDKGYVKKSIIISTISFLISAPIIINNYYSINLLSIIFNIIYVPYCVFILFPMAFLTFIFPFLDNFYSFLIFIFEQLSLWFNEMNVLNLSFSRIPIILIFIYYYLLLNKKHKIAICFIIFFYLYNYYSLVPRIYFLDVGQGDSALIRIKNKNILIDTGGSYNQNNSEEYITFFKSVGAKKINYMFLSHGDFDHAGNAKGIIDKFMVEKIYINKYKMTSSEKEVCYKGCKKIGENKIINIAKTKFYILNPKYNLNENDNSLVIYFTLNNKNILFMGDASEVVESRLINEYNLEKIDILKVGHHGSKTSSSKKFINEINPVYSVISVGENNRYGHPNKETINNLSKSQIYRTDRDGSIMFKIKKRNLKIKKCKYN